MPPDPALLQTPSGHGRTLMVPEARHWAAQLHENMTASRGVTTTIGGHPWAGLRREYRNALAGRDDLPIIVLGHQPEFIHPGVWAKHVVADRFARAVGGVALNLIVDNDVLKTSTMALPFGQGAPWSRRDIRFCAAGAATPYEFIPALPREDVVRLEGEFGETLGDAYADSMLPCYIDGLKSRADPRDWVEQTVRARRAVDQVFENDLREHRVSELALNPLLLETIREGERFGHAYNGALQSYRERNAIRDSRRPMPSLLLTEQRWELPWWAVRAGLPRQRLFLVRKQRVLSLCAENSPFLDLAPDDLVDTASLGVALNRQSTWSIRPRAITLTLWARLILADYFIHGIGGAKYDTITDEIIERFFGCPPPCFACVSATLHWDASFHGDNAPDARHLRHAIRDLGFNPQRYVKGSSAMTDHLTRRQRSIDEAQYLARNHPHDHAARRMAFHRIHDVNAAFLEHGRSLLSDLESRLAEAERQARQTAIAQGREYFFAAYPRRELERLMAALPAVADFRV